MARRSMGSLIGTGVMVTFAANELLAMDRDGEDYKPFTNTDFRPIVEGRPNSNFMRIKNVFGTDVSVFGPWDTLVRNTIAVAKDPIGGSKDVLRSKASPLVSLGFNLWSGKKHSWVTQFDPTNPTQMLKEIALPFAYRDIGNEPWAGISIRNSRR